VVCHHPFWTITQSAGGSGLIRSQDFCLEASFRTPEAAHAAVKVAEAETDALLAKLFPTRPNEAA
jgi:hypothetical protein